MRKYNEELIIKYSRKDLISILVEESKNQTTYCNDLDNLAFYDKIIEIIKKNNFFDSKALNEFIEYLDCYQELVKIYDKNYLKAFMKWTNDLHDMQYTYKKLIEEMQDKILKKSGLTDIHHIIWTEYDNQKIEFDFIRATFRETENLFEQLLQDIESNEYWKEYWNDFEEYLFKQEQ